MKDLCLYFNVPSSYREEIYSAIDRNWGCDWYFEKNNGDIKTFDISKLKQVKELPVYSLSSFYWTKGLLKLLKKDYDVYLFIGATRCLSLYVFLFLKKIFFSEKRVYLWTHGYYGKEKWIEKNIFKKPLLKMADGVLLYGNYARNLMLKDGFNPINLYTIHNSLAYSKQLELRASNLQSSLYRTHFSNIYPVIIMIGRLNVRKKLAMIIQAVSRLREMGEFYNIVFVGDGEDKDHLVSMSIELNLAENIWFYGSCYDEKTNAELLYNADLCVIPGDIGLTAIHAMTFGVPVISHNCFKFQGPEFEAIREGETGDFFEYDNIESLANTISRWFSEKSVVRDDVRKACYKEIDERWTPQYQINVLQQIL